MNDTDAHFLAAFRAGDETAFELLAERYRKAITAACERQAPPGEIDDCIQAVFVVLARRPASAARAPVLLAWLHSVAHFVCRDARRAATRRKLMKTTVAQPNPAGNPPEAAVLEQLDTALLRLEERQRAAVLLHASGNTHEDIAKSLGITTANANKLVQRGLATLRDFLYRRGAPISATALLTVLTTQHASATTTVPLSISALSNTSLQVSSLAQGTLMHVSFTATSTWIIAASLAAAFCVGGIIAATTLTPPPAPSSIQKIAPVASSTMPELGKNEEIPRRALADEHKAPIQQEVRANEKKDALVPQAVVTAVRNNPQGQPDLVALTLGKEAKITEGMEFSIYRGKSYIVRVRTEKVLRDMIFSRVLPETWNSAKLRIQQGDLARTIEQTPTDDIKR